jgi:hypothetical protein
MPLDDFPLPDDLSVRRMMCQIRRLLNFLRMN